MKPQKFKSRVERLDSGIRNHVVPVPLDIAERLAKISKRVFVKIGNTTAEIDRAIQGIKSGSPYVGISKKILTEHSLQLGSAITLTLRPNSKPNQITFAAELLEVLKQDDAARARWDTFTTGKQRSLNHYVDTAKRDDTRIRRAVELAEKIRTHTLFDDT